MIFLNLCVCGVWVWMWTLNMPWHTCGSQRVTLGVRLCHPSCLRPGLFLFATQTLACLTHGLLGSLPPSHQRSLIAAAHHWVHGLWGFEPRFSGLHGKHFTHWALSKAANIMIYCINFSFRASWTMSHKFCFDALLMRSMCIRKFP